MSYVATDPTSVLTRSTRLGMATRTVRELTLLAAGLAGAGTVLVIRDPHGHGSFGICPSRLLGLYCPGCGGLRGTHDLLTFHWREAVGENLLLIPALVLFGWWWVSQLSTALGRPMKGPSFTKRSGLFVFVVLIAFTVARNLPGSPLAP